MATINDIVYVILFIKLCIILNRSLKPDIDECSARAICLQIVD